MLLGRKWVMYGSSKVVHQTKKTIIFYLTDKPIIKCACHFFSDIIQSASSEGTTTRKIVYNSIQGCIDLCSVILSAFVTDTGREFCKPDLKQSLDYFSDNQSYTNMQNAFTTSKTVHCINTKTRRWQHNALCALEALR